MIVAVATMRFRCKEFPCLGQVREQSRCCAPTKPSSNPLEEGLSVFGSVARDEATDASDVDLLVQLSPEMPEGGCAHFGRLDDLTRRLSAPLGRNFDGVAEPVARRGCDAKSNARPRVSSERLRRRF